MIGAGRPVDAGGITTGERAGFRRVPRPRHTALVSPNAPWYGGVDWEILQGTHMRGRGTGGLLIVALGVGMAVGQDPILPPIPDGPTLTILQAGDQIPVIPPKSLPPLPPPPAALPKQMPPSSGAIAPAISTQPPPMAWYTLMSRA